MAFAADKIRQGAAGTGDFTIDQSLRFDNTVYPNNSNLSYLSKTPSAASNRRTFTWSIWLKRGRVDSDSTFVYAGPSNNDAFRMQIDGSDNMINSPEFLFSFVCIFNFSNLSLLQFPFPE